MEAFSSPLPRLTGTRGTITELPQRREVQDGGGGGGDPRRAVEKRSRRLRHRRARRHLRRPKKPSDPPNLSVEIGESSKRGIPSSSSTPGVSVNQKEKLKEDVDRGDLGGLSKLQSRWWAGLFNLARREEEWQSSKELNEKIERIQESSKGKVFIVEDDPEKILWKGTTIRGSKNLMPKV
ncbi:hypothetical protein Cni_G01894 [Canna indica]|uniref:Uncharacterized protein n=1 Tax=Canna indica TaxID=4628 RepID=A0AAQ3JRK6_9LILI|nr:hypothetical protein Cni_G01894 [Canna indica]